MTGTSKAESLILALMMGSQIVLLLISNGVIAAFVPSIVAAIALAYQPLKRDQSFRAMVEKPWRPLITITIFITGTGAWFALGPNDLPFILQFVRVLMIDVAIIWLATFIRVRAHVAR